MQTNCYVQKAYTSANQWNDTCQGSRQCMNLIKIAAMENVTKNFQFVNLNTDIAMEPGMGLCNVTVNVKPAQNLQVFLYRFWPGIIAFVTVCLSNGEQKIHYGSDDFCR